jgi:GrpB-like predicted nucleotidyltransferase (UPF0157 family)
MQAITIVSYNERWPQQFAEIGAALRRALGALALRIDHIGSTAVRGLAAKDRIDVQITVAGFERFEPVQEGLERLGYTIVGGNSRDHQPPGWEGQASEWEKRFFRPPPSQRPTNLHVRALGRAHPRSAAAYAELKRRLASNLRDLETYPEVKDPACDLIIVAAQDWAVTTGWKPGLSDA